LSLSQSSIQPWLQMTQILANVFNGYLEGITLADIVQLACLERYERKMEVRGENFHGIIYFAQGEIVHAQAGNLTGAKAFLEIMCCPGGTFSFTSGTTETLTIHDSWNFLLMEAMRFIDERSDTVSLASAFTSLSVLVVDDSRIFTKALVKLFDEELGARIAGKATNVEEALKILEMEKPDLVTMDVNMSVASGYMPLKHIMIRTPVPVALMSDFSETNFSTMMEYLCLGAVDLVEKPKDSESWNIVGKRFKRLGQNIKEFRIKNIRRARTPAVADFKIPVGEPAQKLFIILGGVGSLIELQKILVSIQSNRSAAGLIFLDLYPGVTTHLASYFEKLTIINPMNLESKMPILSSQCGITYWHGSWEVTIDDNGAAVPIMINDSGLLDADSLLKSASWAFGAQLSVIILSGTDLQMTEGLMEVSARKGRIYLQEPDSCLFPGPILQLEALRLHESFIEAEKVTDLLGDILK
jgi:two-component system chemotaxis response regulator CheB